MRALTAALTVILVCACSTTSVRSQNDTADGAQLFARHCAECHAPELGRPGTQQLGWIRGDDFAVLEQRSDLNAAYVKVVVRNGLLEMPAFFPSVLPDEDLERIAGYLAGD